MASFGAQWDLASLLWLLIFLWHMLRRQLSALFIYHIHFGFVWLMTHFVSSNALVSESFMIHPDGISSLFKFTYKLEMDSRLPFLDAFFTRQYNGALATTIYHKPTHIHKPLLTIHFTPLTFQTPITFFRF